MRVIDCVMYSYEYDALEIRMEALRDVVDLHVVVQGDRTFRGQRRDITSVPGVPMQFTVEMPTWPGPWDMERFLRDMTGTLGARFAEPGDLLLIADADEIPHPDAIRQAVQLRRPMVLETDYREWFMDWRAVDHHLHHQPVIATPNAIEQAGGACSARWDRKWPAARAIGWHLSNLGDVAAEKLRTFAHTEYDTAEHRERIRERRAAGEDFLGRFRLERTDDLPPGAELFPHLMSPS